MSEQLDICALARLDMLVKGWREYLDRHPAANDFSRAAGYRDGIQICAQQLAETLERMRGDE